MRTIKDLMKVLSGQLHDNDLETIIAASDLNAVEIQDADFEKLEGSIKSLMDVEAASANKSVVDKILAEKKAEIQNQTLYAVEKRLPNLAAKLGIEIPSDKKKAHEILDYFEEKATTSKGGDEETKRLIQSLKDDKDELAKAIDKQKEEFETKLQEKDNEFTGQSVRREFNLAAKDLNWADAYKTGDINEALIDRIHNKVSAKAVLKLVDGKLVPFQKEHPEKEFYIGNKKATFQDLIGPEVEPYLKKADPTPKNGTPEKKDYVDMNAAEKRALAMKQAHEA